MEELFSRDRRVPRGLLILVPAVAFLIILGLGTYKRTDVPVAGEAVPDFTAPLLVGDGELTMSDLEGKPVVLNFWASWCAPCKDEAPLLQAAHERYGDRITFLGVDIRDAMSDALEFVDEYGLTYTSVRDEGMHVYADYGLTGQPETFFIDADGILVEHVPGPVDEESLFQAIDVLLRRDA
jgi:cytochrome c biogenesis protein CcmG, thiol:disulfide interchange protein DsbE